MARSEQPRRRFAPEPIETTFRSTASNQKHQIGQSHNGRQHNQQPPQPGPNYELTPEPSPRSPSPIPQELLPRRRFAPQLIETSRRSRRVGDVGPATRPTDKTDITPYTKNIYTAPNRHRAKQNDETTWEHAPTRRESEDEHVQQYLLELAAKEAERQMQEDALAAFPNSHAREGGVDHFYFRESSESEGSPESTSPALDGSHHPPARRQSSNLGLNWWHKHMQKHAQQHTQDNVLDSDGDEDMMSVDENAQDASQQKSAEPAEPVEPADVTRPGKSAEGEGIMRTDSDLDKMDLTVPPDPMWITTNNQQQERPVENRAHKGPIGETFMPLIQADASTSLVREKHVERAPASARPIGESPMPYVPPTPSSKPADLPYAKPSQIPPDTGFRKQASPFGRPFGGLGQKAAAPRTKQVSPPMLGKDLVFRRCPSPKTTKLEPEPPKAEPQPNKRPREDTGGQKGLWRGYCARSDSNDDFLVPADLHAPPMMATPRPPATPGESDYGSASLSDEPSSLSGSESRGRTGYPQRLHQPGDGLWKGTSRAPKLDDKISQEFDDSFVTQVYNYLSLGYPATARAYDDELSQITHMSIVELEQDDEKQLAKGHLFEADAETPRHMQCPRWKALRKYVTEWARQHPNLDSMDGLGWGVRERRGSWAI